jgi:hypothetical protein
MIAIIILAFAMVLMLPLALLPFISSAHETMEKRYRVRPQLVSLSAPAAQVEAEAPAFDHHRAA